MNFKFTVDQLNKLAERQADIDRNFNNENQSLNEANAAMYKANQQYQYDPSGENWGDIPLISPALQEGWKKTRYVLEALNQLANPNDSPYRFLSKAERDNLEQRPVQNFAGTLLEGAPMVMGMPVGGIAGDILAGGVMGVGTSMQDPNATAADYLTNTALGAGD